MSVISVVWVLLITSHGHSQVMPYAYDTKQECKSDAKEMTRKMDKGSKWECSQVVIAVDKADMMKFLIKERKKERKATEHLPRQQ